MLFDAMNPDAPPMQSMNRCESIACDGAIVFHPAARAPVAAVAGTIED
jgi:hypothetical protein